MKPATYSQEVGDCSVTTIVSGRYRENGYVLTHRASRTAAIIDPGGRAEDFEAILDRSGAQLAGIVLTHGHFDHVGAVHPLTERYGAPCWLETRDQKLAKQASLFGLRFEGSKIRPPSNVSLFDAPTKLDLGANLAFDIIHTPGHTPGSVTLCCGGVAFVGDLIFRELVGPTVYPGSDRAELIRSIDALLAQIAPEVVLFAGHGRPWTATEARAWWAVHAENPPAMKLFGEPNEKPSQSADAP